MKLRGLPDNYDYPRTGHKNCPAPCCGLPPRAGAEFPHCDQRVLHGKECRYCNEYPEYQRLRELWGICYTGEKPSAEKKIPCPSEVERPLETINLWQGNRIATKRSVAPRMTASVEINSGSITLHLPSCEPRRLYLDTGDNTGPDGWWLRRTLRELDENNGLLLKQGKSYKLVIEYTEEPD